MEDRLSESEIGKDNSDEDESVNITVKWRAESFEFTMSLSESLSELKFKIQGLTNISSSTQKLIGFSKVLGSKNDSLSLKLNKATIKNGMIKINLIGTPDVEIAVFNQQKCEAVKAVFNDFSHSFTPATEEWQKLNEFSEKVVINYINEPREGKKLLVLDLDHTLLDFSSKENVSPADMKRPYMDWFLSELYPYYDIAIWSQTGWRWLELKVCMHIYIYIYICVHK
jgi:ubiquitin-like domain-containing CTD phosphatase 1